MDVGNNWNRDGLKPCYPVKTCPFCGVYPRLSTRYTKDGRVFVFSHYCEKIARYYESAEQEKAAEMWNVEIEAVENREAQLSLF